MLNIDTCCVHIINDLPEYDENLMEALEYIDNKLKNKKKKFYADSLFGNIEAVQCQLNDFLDTVFLLNTIDMANSKKRNIDYGISEGIDLEATSIPEIIEEQCSDFYQKRFDFFWMNDLISKF